MPVERHQRTTQATRTKDRGLEQESPERRAGRPGEAMGPGQPTTTHLPTGPPAHQPLCPPAHRPAHLPTCPPAPLPTGPPAHQEPNPAPGEVMVIPTIQLFLKPASQRVTDSERSGGGATATWRFCRSQGWKETRGSGTCEDGDRGMPSVFCWDPREPPAFNLGKTEKEATGKGQERGFRGGYFQWWPHEYLLYDTLMILYGHLCFVLFSVFFFFIMKMMKQTRILNMRSLLEALLFNMVLEVLVSIMN